MNGLRKVALYYMVIEHILQGFPSTLAEEIVMRKLTPYSDQISEDRRILLFVSRSKIQCIWNCLVTDDCKSLFYHETNKTCSLHRNFVFPTSNKISQAGWLYFESYTSDEAISTAFPDPCSGCPFANGYTCISTHPLCYKYYDTSNIDPYQSRQTCMNDGGDLLGIRNSMIQAEVESIMSTVPEGAAWIQGKWNGSNWIFEDGTLMTYFNWNAGQGAGLVSEPLIIVRRTSGYKWHDAATTHTEFAILCEVPL